VPALQARCGRFAEAKPHRENPLGENGQPTGQPFDVE
jgi:hypothetical protein